MQLNAIPSLQELLDHPDLAKADIDRRYVKRILESQIRDLRDSLRRAEYTGEVSRDALRKALLESALRKIHSLQRFRLQRVVNATGIILHTNLGRAPLAGIARQHLQQVLENYCNLEIDLVSGKRGDRHQLLEEIIGLITNADDAVVVNNNAAAILLALNSLCRRKEVPVSRGELVEIGGSFRMPEVMRAGNVKMVEIGTTNKTHLKDYEDALSPRTGGILKVHTSNYRVIGFTQAVEIKELVNLAHRHHLPLIYDMGSGVLENLENWGYPYEPVAREYMDAGVDIITFSADKVLGGPQAGIIIGKKVYIDKIRKNHLLRALRCDKTTYALLDATLRLYLQPAKLKRHLPVCGMLTLTRSELHERAKLLVENLKGLPLVLEVIDTYSQMGSGALPLEKIPSVAVRIVPRSMPVATLAGKLREAVPPIIGYLEKNACLLNLRTIREDEFPLIQDTLHRLFQT